MKSIVQHCQQPLKPIIFLQEAKAKKHVKEAWKIEEFHYDGRVTGTSCHRSGLSTPIEESLLKESKVFTLTKYLYNDPKTRELDNRTFAREVIIEHEYEQKYVGRASLIVVSTHIPHKESVEKKKAMIINLFEKMCSVANEKHKTVVVGGDFNLEISNWKKNVEKNSKKRVSIWNYDPSPRRQGRGVIDTFAIVYPIGGRGRLDRKSVDDCSIESCVPIYPLPLFGHIYESHHLKVDELLTDYPDAGDVQYKIAKYNKEDVYTLHDLIQEKMKKATSTKEEANSQQISEDTSRDITMEPQCTPTSSTDLSTGNAASQHQATPTSAPRRVLGVVMSREQADSFAKETDKQANLLSKEIAELISSLAEMTSFLGDMSAKLARLLAKVTASSTEMSAELVSSLAERIASFIEMAAKQARSIAKRISKLVSLLPDMAAKVEKITKYVQMQSKEIEDFYFKLLNHDPLLAKLKIKLELSKIEQSPDSPSKQKQQLQTTPASRPKKKRSLAKKKI